DLGSQRRILELACDRRSWPSQRPARETQCFLGRRSIRGVITAKSIGPLFRPSPSVFSVASPRFVTDHSEVKPKHRPMRHLLSLQEMYVARRLDRVRQLIP